MRSTGLKYLTLGEDWRRRYLRGSPIAKIATEDREAPQTVSRAVWLAKVPEDIKESLKAHPEIFTRRILLNGFAAKRRQCEQENFKLLRSEIQRLIQEGVGAQLNLKKTNKYKKGSKKNEDLSLLPDANEETSTTYEGESAREAEFRIHQALGYSCRVVFNKAGGGEVRIFFRDKKALGGLIETFEPFSKKLF